MDHLGICNVYIPGDSIRDHFLPENRGHQQPSSLKRSPAEWPGLYIIYLVKLNRDLTQPQPKWWFSKGNPLISGKPRWVKYNYNLARYIYKDVFFPDTFAAACFFQASASSGSFEAHAWRHGGMGDLALKRSMANHQVTPRGRYTTSKNRGIYPFHTPSADHF